MGVVFGANIKKIEFRFLKIEKKKKLNKKKITKKINLKKKY